MKRTLFELIVIVIVIARMTRSDHLNTLELSIRPHSGVDSAVGLVHYTTAEYIAHPVTCYMG